MKQIFYSVLLVVTITITGCSENYSNGERIGLVTQFSHKGVVWKSWEGKLNLTQTGMNSSGAEPFSFSVDNDNENPTLLKTIDSAANYGWKVKMIYHETFGKNWFRNRGETDHFLTDCIVLDKNPIGDLFKNKQDSLLQGRVRDTVYLVIYRDKK